jgi:O-antigen ligase
MLLICSLYIVQVVLANLGVSFNLEHLIKYYPEHGIVRCALIFNEPLFMGLNFLLAVSLSEYINRGRFVLVLFCIGIFLSFSISAWLLMFLYFFVRNFSVNYYQVRFYAILIFGVISLVMLFLVFEDRILNIFSLRDGSTRIRIALTFASIDMFLDHWLLGVGVGNSGQLMSQYENEYFSSINMVLTYSTNLYLSVLSESGILGFCAFFIFLICLLKRALIRRELLAGFVVILVSFMQQSVFLSPVIWFFWIYLVSIRSRHV